MATPLTEEQHTVSVHRDGHAMVSAVPGSGKTTTMSHYVYSLIEEGLSPKLLLVLMFNKNTRTDFKNKLHKMGVPGALDKDFPVFTYHGMAYRLCNYFVENGFMQPFNLETSEFRQKYAASIALRKAFPTREFNSRKKELIDSLMSFIDYHKSVFLSEKETFAKLGFKEKDSALLRAFQIFEQDRKRKNIYYFSDMLREAVNVLMNNPVALAKMANKKERIVVDEFQDTNPVQYEMVKRLAGTRGQLMVVGDIDQTIYEFCGADPEFMRHQCQRDFKDLQFYPMSYTFRYGQDLASVSSNLIRNNRQRFDQDCVSFNKEQEMDLTAHGLSIDEEPNLVVDLVREAVDPKGKQKLSYQDIAIICRVYGAAGGIEMEMLKNGIPCIIPKESSILRSREMVVVMAISRLLGCFEQGDNNVGWHLVRQTCGQDLNELTSNTKLNFLGGDVREAIIRDFVEDNDAGLALDRFMSNHPLAEQARQEKPYTKRILADEPLHVSMALSSNGRSMAKGFYKKLTAVIRSLDIRDQLKGRCMTQMDEEVSERRLDAILGYIKFHDMDRDEFVDDITTLRDQQEKTNEVKDGVLITSVHKAKGLEWPMVIMPTLEEGLFPFEPQDGMTNDLLESERRLFYVAMTRTKHTLHLIGPDTDFQYQGLLKGKDAGTVKKMETGASRFLFEMDMKDGGFRFVLHGAQKPAPGFREGSALFGTPGGDSRSIDTGGL